MDINELRNITAAAANNNIEKFHKSKIRLYIDQLIIDSAKNGSSKIKFEFYNAKKYANDESYIRQDDAVTYYKNKGYTVYLTDHMNSIGYSWRCINISW